MAALPTLLLALDVDGTLCDSSDLADLFEEDYETWCAAVVRLDTLPVAGAVHALAELPAIPTVIVTSRAEHLRDETRRWLDHHFPRLTTARLFMRANDDERQGWEVKRDLLEAVRRSSRVFIVDDDGQVMQALRPGDVFIQSPHNWPELRAALGA